MYKQRPIYPIFASTTRKQTNAIILNYCIVFTQKYNLMFLFRIKCIWKEEYKHRKRVVTKETGVRVELANINPYLRECRQYANTFSAHFIRIQLLIYKTMYSIVCFWLHHNNMRCLFHSIWGMYCNDYYVLYSCYSLAFSV